MSEPSTPVHLVVMGVSGSGKSAVGRPLAERLGVVFAEGDEFHSQANLDKMSTGTPLVDEDRWPWLRDMAEWTRERDRVGESTVLACSALRRSYRDALREGLPGTWFVHLHGDKGLMLQRMQGREHFFAPTMLESQLDTLELLAADEQGFVADIADPIDVIVDKVVGRLPAQS